MRVSIETDLSRIVIDDKYESADVEKLNQHNQELVKLAYQYVTQRDLMLKIENGVMQKVN